MSEIPEDIKGRARIAYNALYGIDNDDGREPWELEDIDTIAAAILAERKRCAEVARGLNGWGPIGGNKVAEHIAKVIEAGP